MAKKQLIKNPNEAQPNTKLNGTLYSAALYKVDSDGSIAKDTFGRFLLNPASYEEGKTSNWNPQVIPGLSDPALQWTSSGLRTISFEALVTHDLSDLGSVTNASNAPSASQSTSFVANIAANFFNVPAINPRTDSTNSQNMNPLSIRDHLNYYRSMLYPEYKSGKLTSSPPLLVLYAGSNFLPSNVSYGNTIQAGNTVWVLTDLRIKITKQLPNLTPMEALVTFQLAQYPIQSTDARNVTGSILPSVTTKAK